MDITMLGTSQSSSRTSKRTTKEQHNCWKEAQSASRGPSSQKIKKSEQVVLKTQEAIENSSYPFTVEDQNKVYIISYGAPAPANMEANVLKAEASGKLTRELLIKDRLEKKDTFFEPVQRWKWKRWPTSISRWSWRQQETKLLSADNR